MADMSTKKRDSLKDSDFAVPSKRKLPINDAKHVLLAWDMVDKTEGLTDKERKEARRRILERAKKLGIDTSDWNTKLHADNELGESGSESCTVTKISFTNIKASSFILGELEHPNKMPFSGILTYFDVPSDNAPHGSKGRKVMIPSEVGIPALDSLVGMAVNYVEGSMDGHSPQDKIGVITKAYAGDPLENGAVPVHIEGYIYAYDFEQAALDIKLNQASLGFSYETANTLIVDGVYNDETVAVVRELGYFTGASILYAAEAAYTNTSLAASADDETNNNESKEGLFSVEGLKEILDAIHHLKDYVDHKFESLIKGDEPAVDDKKVEEAKDEKVEVKADAPEADKEEKAVEDVDAEPVKEADKAEEVKPADEVKPEEVKPEEAKPEEVKPAVEEAEVKAEEPAVQTEEKADVKVEGEVTELNAATELKAELERVKAELAELKASKEALAAQRKSVLYPTSLMAKYDLDEKDEFTNLMASIESREDLSVEERLALKFAMRDKQRKENK